MSNFSEALERDSDGWGFAGDEWFDYGMEAVDLRRERNREYQRRWRLAHPQRKREYNRQYRKRNSSSKNPERSKPSVCGDE